MRRRAFAVTTRTMSRMVLVRRNVVVGLKIGGIQKSNLEIQKKTCLGPSVYVSPVLKPNQMHRLARMKAIRVGRVGVLSLLIVDLVKMRMKQARRLETK